MSKAFRFASTRSQERLPQVDGVFVGCQNNAAQNPHALCVEILIRKLERGEIERECPESKGTVPRVFRVINGLRLGDQSDPQPQGAQNRNIQMHVDRIGRHNFVLASRYASKRHTKNQRQQSGGEGVV